MINIKDDNSIMCLWFQTKYYGEGQQKHPTAQGELYDLRDSPYALFFVLPHIMQFETINTYLGLLFKQS